MWLCVALTVSPKRTHNGYWALVNLEGRRELARTVNDVEEGWYCNSNVATKQSTSVQTRREIMAWGFCGALDLAKLSL